VVKNRKNIFGFLFVGNPCMISEATVAKIAKYPKKLPKSFGVFIKIR